jgi:hypothetical protein
MEHVLVVAIFLNLIQSLAIQLIYQNTLNSKKLYSNSESKITIKDSFHSQKLGKDLSQRDMNNKTEPNQLFIVKSQKFKLKNDNNFN